MNCIACFSFEGIIESFEWFIIQQSIDHLSKNGVNRPRGLYEDA